MKNNTITPAQQSLINEFVSLNINAADFAIVMAEKYNYYYEAEESGKDSYCYEDVQLFDMLLTMHGTPIRRYIDEVVKARQDIISSDRECAAFIAAIHYFVYESPKQDASPTFVPDALLEKYCNAGCTFGRVKDTKHIQVVRVASPWGKFVFLYKGTKRGAFEELKKQFDGFVQSWTVGNKLYLYFAAAEKDIPGTEIDKAEIVAHCEQLYAAGLKAAAIDWHVRNTCFAPMPLALPTPAADTLTAADATSKETAPAPIKNPNMLQDWGEKIGGARKDEATNHSTGESAPTIKKLKYGVTGYIRNGIMCWYPKISPRRYSTAYCVEYGEKVSLISAEYLIMRDEAERLLIEKYPNIENIFNFEIYSTRAGYVVTAKRIKIDVATFATLDEARAYMQSDKPAADLAALKAARTPEQKTKRAAALVVRNSINRPRLGTDYVQDGNITPEELATMFGLRAVEFGNWMTADDRQTSINECYNSLCTLAELLRIERYQIGRGTLAIAFGARGTGKANAHYECAKHVINLTRTRGAGSLAHEWAHSVDFNGTNQKSLSRGFYFLGFSWRSKETGSYWGKEEEQFARAFETAIHYMLKDREVVDDYLVNIKEGCKVYPTELENKRIAPYVIEKIKTALQ